MAKNKIIYGGEVLIDLTQDDVTASDVKAGIKFHLPSGEIGTGTSTHDSDTSEATAVASEILSGRTAYARGTELTGTMPNNGAVSGNISTKVGVYTIPQGYHDGSGTVQIASVEQQKIIAENIKAGVEILGVTGEYSGESISAQTKSVNATKTPLTVLPDTGYDYLSEVTVTIPYVETPNSAGGTTVTIA